MEAWRPERAEIVSRKAAFLVGHGTVHENKEYKDENKKP